MVDRVADALKEMAEGAIYVSLFEIDDDGAKALADALAENQTLESLTCLSLYAGIIGDDGAKALADALAENQTLKDLSLSGGNIGDDGAKALVDALAVNGSLTSLRLEGGNIGDDGAKALADALAVNGSLTSLRLSDNRIGDDGAAALAHALAQSTSLQELDLQRNRIGDDGAAALAHALVQSTSLQELDLQRNRIGDDGSAALAHALPQSTSLQELDLQRNRIGDDGAAALAHALPQSMSLQELDLQRNRIGDDGAAALAHALAQSTTLLRELHLRRNNFGNAGAEALAIAVEGNGILARLSLDDEEISSEILARIADHVKLTKKELEDMSAMAQKGLKDNVKVRWGRAKLMIVGKSAAGKTSTIRTLLDQPFNDDHVSTIGVDLTLTRTRDWKERENFGNADLGEQFAKYKYRRQSFPQRVSRRMAGVAARASASRESSLKEGRPAMQIAEWEIAEAVRTPLRLQIKEEADKLDEEVSFTIWDYGGQEVFYALHHLFLTQYGVYVLVFDMREVLGKERFEKVPERDKLESLASQKDALDTLRFWITSIHLHAPNVSVALVGTYLDQVPNEGDHRAINQTIKSEVLKGLGGRPAVLRNRSSQLQFFSINNKDREDTDAHVSRLREALSESVAKKDFVKDKVPLRWSYCLDRLLSSQEDFLSLDEVEKFAKRCNLAKEDVHKMLKYMHELGVLIHLTTGENDVLRQFVVIRPQWLLENLSRVICDPDMDHMQRHKDNLLYRCSNEDGGEFPSELEDALEEWSGRGVASRALLEKLWQDQPVDYLTELMESMLLACPSPWIGDKDDEGALLIPSLLKPVDEDTKEKARADLGRTFALAYIEFRILPKGVFGVFQRLLASLVQVLPNRVSVGDHGVYADFASIVFDNVDVVMETSGNRLMLYFELPANRSLSSHVVILKNSLDSIDSFFMKKGLDPKLYVSSDGSDHRAACASAEALAHATDGEVSLVKRGKRLPLTSFRPFVERRSATRHPRLSIASTDKPYHVFLSHSWGEGKETHERVKAVARELETRGIRYWLDEKEVGQEVLDSMANGIDRSKVVVVFVTREYMNKVNRGRSELDNCRDEFCYAFRRVKPANMIPCILDKEMSDMNEWEGRFGISWSGNPLYVPMWKGGEADEIDALEAAIKDVLRLQNEAAVRPEDVPATTTLAVHRRRTLSRLFRQKEDVSKRSMCKSDRYNHENALKNS